MKNYYLTSFILITILVIAAILRLWGLNWDQGFHLHPDERMISIVAADIHLPQTTIEWDNLLTKDSVLNPKFFAYGSLPIYLLKITGSLVGAPDYQSINIVGRFLSSIFDLGTIFLIYLVGQNLFNRKIGLISSFSYAVSVLPIQLSHFYAVDTLLTFFGMAVFYCLIKFNKYFQFRWLIFSGIFFGLTLSTKTSAVLLFIPILLIFLTAFKKVPLKKLFDYALCILLLTIVTFLITEPFALIDLHNFLGQTWAQQAMTKSAFTFPYTLQYVGKIPILYEVKNIFFWGLGPFMALLAFLGLILIHYQVFKTRDFYIIPILVWFWIYFLIVSSFAIGFMRYLLPIYPLLSLCTGFFVYQIYRHLKSYFPTSLFVIFTSIFLILILVWPLTFISIYDQPNTRVTATKWIHTNIPIGARILNEHWDDGLPLDRANLYKIDLLALYEPETPAKWISINNQLQLNDYIILASNRLYTPLQKLTNCQALPKDRCYRETANYYQRLFSNQTGYKKVMEFEVRPKIPFTNFYIDDLSADESFTVYDHPKVIIFKNTPKI